MADAAKRRADVPPAGCADAGLPADLRQLAARAAEVAGGGLALVFQRVPGAPAGRGGERLRAAAGFATAQEARQGAAIVSASLGGPLDSPRRIDPDPALGPRAAGGLWLYPLIVGESRHGVLAATAADPLGSEPLRAIQEIAERMALRLECAQLGEQVEALRLQLSEQDASHEEKNEEILKLSEALFAQDIEILRSSEKLGKIEKLKNDFIEKMSRELRTPLNSIIEAIISVLTGEDDALSEEAKTALRRALDQGTAFLRTLQNILDLWRIRQGELPVEIQEVNLSEVVEEVVFSFQDDIAAKSLVVEPKIDPALPKLRTDLTKLNQILFLLVDNAVRFTQQGQIEIRARLEGQDLLCEVRDTGIGICADDQQFIFDEFYQVDDEAPDGSGGAGLGLALVRDLVVLLDGEVTVHSEVGEGTTIRLRVPVQGVPQ